MEGFKFNFDANPVDVIPEKENFIESESTLPKPTVVNQSDKHLIKVIGCLNKNSLNVGPVTIQYHQCGDEIESQLKLSNSAICSALKSHSDLVPGVYEGGLKVWECSIDLARYVAESIYFHPEESVLELGCGAGLPGIVAHVRGAARVVFQDFNAEVLDAITVPNVLLNSNNQASGCSFVAGDWAVVAPEISKIIASFDVILTSETIYNPSSLPKLVNLFKTFLKPNGCIFLAAKSCYFGVGGSVRQFENFIEQDGTFEVNTCSVLNEGVKRVILKLTFKNDQT